jgi:hypothetical protein
LVDPRDGRVTSSGSLLVSEEQHWESNLPVRSIPIMFQVGFAGRKYVYREETSVYNNLITAKQNLTIIA